MLTFKQIEMAPNYDLTNANSKGYFSLLSMYFTEVQKLTGFSKHNKMKRKVGGVKLPEVKMGNGTRFGSLCFPRAIDIVTELRRAEKTEMDI